MIFNKRKKPILTAQQLVENAKQHITELNVTQTANRLNQTELYQIIDVREPDEFAQGHLANAHNIPRGVLEFKIEEAVSNKSTPIVVYCKTGGRAALSAHALQTLGYTDVISIEGGYESWITQHQPSATI